MKMTHGNDICSPLPMRFSFHRFPRGEVMCCLTTLIDSNCSTSDFPWRTWWTWRLGRGRRCSTCHSSSPECSYSWGRGERWPACPVCRRSQCAGGRVLRRLSTPGATVPAYPAWWIWGSRRGSRSRGSPWSGRAASTNLFPLCLLRWSLRNRAILYAVSIWSSWLYKTLSNKPIRNITTTLPSMFSCLMRTVW